MESTFLAALRVTEQATVCDLELISYVADRPGHDRRYAIDSTKIQSELGWKPLHTPREGIRQTVQWYLDNREWWEPLLTKPVEVAG